ncbi:SDR family oxidoreductase [Persicobacter diffluens]|uniref:Short-chain dehydrogenase n=1 Tax=Persicobacter diffluens TaxID=981 RepID=A0AAN4W107_9BACT|nr:short-chain dehydrogenase [Persicobacter diffluens]
MQAIKGKTALITGGSKGIGFGIAEALINEGVHVAITSRSQSAAEAAAEELVAIGGGEVLAFEADVRSLKDQQKVIEAMEAKWGRVDVVIANAGVGHFGSIESITAEQWQETIDINLTGVFNTTKAAIEPLKKSKGYLITIASLAGTNFFAGGSAYNASKFGLVGFSQAVMLDLRKYGIKMTTIMPGSVTSYFNGHEPAETDAWKIQPEDLGQMVVDLMQMHPRTLPSKIEVRPTTPPQK